MTAVQTIAPVDGAFASFELFRTHEYVAPTVDLLGREPEHNEGWIVVLIFFVAAAAYAYVTYCTSRGGDAEVSQGFRSILPYWKVKCDMP